MNRRPVPFRRAHLVLEPLERRWLPSAAMGYIPPQIYQARDLLELSPRAPAVIVASSSASMLVVTSPPPSRITAGVPFIVTVKAESADGKIDPSYNNAVTLALQGGPGAIAGPLKVAAKAGVAVFRGLVVTRAGAGYQLEASASGVTPTTPTSFDVVPARATHLAITTPPPNPATAGKGFVITVTARDAFGNVATSFGSNVGLSILVNPGHAILRGTTLATARAGVATFSAVEIDTAAAGYVLKATFTSLPPITTLVNVVADKAAKLVVTTQPPANVTAGLRFTVTVAALDRFGNLATAFNDSIGLGFQNNPPGASLKGATSVPASGGRVSFGSLTIEKAANGYTLKATADGLTAAITKPVNVKPAAVAKLAFTRQPPGSIPADVAFPNSIVVAAQDAFGNATPSYAGAISLALSPNIAGATLSGLKRALARAGVAIFAGLSIHTPGTAYTLLATATGLAQATSDPVDVTSAGGHIAYTIEDPSTSLRDVFLIAAQPGAVATNISTQLNALSTRPASTNDAELNISPDGQWLVLDTARFGMQNNPGLAIVRSDLSAGAAVVDGNGQNVFNEGLAAVASGGNLIVYSAGGGPHTRDLWALSRTANGSPWSKPLLLTASSSFAFNFAPAISRDGAEVVFEAGNVAQDQETGNNICEVLANGAGFVIKVTATDHPPGSVTNAVGACHQPAFAPDGSIVFESDWNSEQIYRLPVGQTVPILVSPTSMTNDNSPCVLPDGRIVSLWLNRSGNTTGVHELTVHAADGSYLFTLQPGVDVFDIGYGCGA